MQKLYLLCKTILLTKTKALYHDNVTMTCDSLQTTLANRQGRQ